MSNTKGSGIDPIMTCQRVRREVGQEGVRSWQPPIKYGPRFRAIGERSKASPPEDQSETMWKAVWWETITKVWREASWSNPPRPTLLLIRAISNYLNCGWVRNNRETFEFRVTRLTDIIDKLIPLFQINKIHGQKRFYFADWCFVPEMMEKKNTSLKLV